ncbi:MAG: replicative DNA helicase [Gammaproteobacteria bacterium RIFOXYA12_FULL_61_12]|nr:MAG: replicative DNA helicase [Gammaproteobacteria bacterium RIFOXYA12_FULL_61_12]OGT91356.1 MAG: replicative DNA helicase [Gammaproteobacteria bacterium RIFOXYD12_FULL_61_37]
MPVSQTDSSPPYFENAASSVEDRLRIPPHSVQAEQSVLGGLMLDNSTFDQIADRITERDFYLREHQLIFRAVDRLAEQGKPLDVVTLNGELERVGVSQDCGGLAYLGTLAKDTPSAANIRAYADIVREHSVKRQLIRVGTGIADSGFNPEGRNGTELLDEAERKVFEIAEQRSKGERGFQPLSKLLSTAVDRIETLFEQDDPITGVSTGFVDFDHKTSGMQPGDLIIIAGRPSMGKAQPLDARVRKRHGWISMGELAPGDELASVDGAPSAVTGIFPQGIRQVYRVRFSDGRSTECCAEHLWRVHYREWREARVLRTDQVMAMLVRVRYRGRLWIEPHNGEFGHDQPLPLDPWLLGALLGDGSLSGTSLRFSTASTEMLERVRARVGDAMTVTHAGAYDYRIVRDDRGHAPGLAGSQPNRIRQALETLGLWGLGSESKFVPRIFLEARRDVRLDLLRGLLDTDGWVERWGSIRLSTASRQLAEDVSELVRSLGGWCSINEKQPHFSGSDGVRRPGRLAYVCHISHPEPSSLLLLSDKQARLSGYRRREKRITFAAIEPSRQAPCQCIAVSHPSRLYITDHDVVTHNTAFAMNIAENVSIKVQRPVAVFSMEMPGESLAMRMMSSLGRIDQHRVRTGRLEDDEWPRLTSAINLLSNASMFIDDTPALTPTELRARARRLKREQKDLALIVIDYLQLMQAPGAAETRANEVSAISRSLKALAKELSVPVVALSQLNRGLEQRTNKRPIMSDLRESGSIEQDADLVVFLYRDEYYNPESQDKGVAEVIISKQRNGPTGTVRMSFQGQYTLFADLMENAGYGDNY